jgi:hypothetical protein
LRIDRYYSSEDTFLWNGEKKKILTVGITVPWWFWREMENPQNNPQVAFQPTNVSLL